MPAERKPDLSLFLDILKTLEKLNAPYMVIGAFAATVYGITRVTYDIDIIVELSEEHINALSNSYPLPRYYADPVMIRNSIEMGIMFNIIDTERGEKADLVPLSGTLDYRHAFERRIRQLVEISGAEPFEIWCARPEDVIHGVDQVDGALHCSTIGVGRPVASIVTKTTSASVTLTVSRLP